MGFFSRLFGMRREDEETKTPITETGEEIVEEGGAIEGGASEEDSPEEPIV